MKKILILFFLILVSVRLSSLGFTADQQLVPVPVIENGIAWYNTKDWGNEGRGWNDTASHFSRLPERAKGKVTNPVWELSQHSSGLLVRFKTDASRILTRHEVGGNLTMPHMTTVGSSGLDLYAKDEQGQWRWAGHTRPNGKKYDYTILDNVPSLLREYMIYLPLYNSTLSLSIGVPEGNVFETVAPSSQKPILYYGSSITQGCSASRPGMTVPAILGRRLHRPMINFGFSGNAKMERELATFIGEVDAAVFIIDSLPNMNPQMVKERAEIFLRELRKNRPETPIVLIEDRTLTDAWLKPNLLKDHEEKRNHLRETYEKLIAEGMTNLVYVKEESLLGCDNEGTVDGSHPTDLGMVRMSDILTPILQKILHSGKP
ncbi:MAG: SGNH/GDSL hydrolase family protein [Planctomycetaceae bacterium]|nr:SGNH/GDSL hydrolase family protein [Planctomycetaceae bacterium]